MKVMILIPYFGTWPSWMDYFLRSCSYNPGFTWIILSDAGKPVDCPPNVVFEPFTLDEFNHLASSRLGLEIDIRNPYKLCDFRPAYGIIFADYLADADFWGYSDMDLVYGKLEHFLERNIFENNDVISVREEYLAGHFALFRNMEKISRLFENSPVHRKVFTDPNKHYAFDERSNMYGRRLPDGNRLNLPDRGKGFFESILNRSKYRLGISLPEFPADMNGVVKTAGQKGEIRVWMKDMVKSDIWFLKNGIPDWEIEWKNGLLRIKDSNEELLHFHFIRSKRKKGFTGETLTGKDGFMISAEGIRPL